MIGKTLTKIFGTRNDRELKRMQPIVDQVKEFAEQVSALTDEELVGKTEEFKERVAQGETLDALMPEAFAVVREAAWRVLEMRHFDCQIIGGLVLHEGKIAEMKTGEGKTLMSTLPVYLNALTGRGVHVVTVNDYLATRDSEWMGAIYRFWASPWGSSSTASTTTSAARPTQATSSTAPTTNSVSIIFATT